MSQLSPSHVSSAPSTALAAENMSRLIETTINGMVVLANSSDGTETTNEPCEGIYCYPDSFFNAATAVTAVLAICGAFGNILTIIAILTSNLRNNINSILICNLSFADTIYCAILLPLQAAAFYYKEWVLSDILCNLHASLRYWMVGVNMTLLSAIAFYRFLNVVHPQTHTCLSQRPWFTIAVVFCWIFPLYFAFTPLVHVWGTWEFNRGILQCTFSSHGSISHKISAITLGYVIPCVFISVCYSRIGCVVFSSRKRSARGSVYRRQRAKRESFRLTAMMVLIFLGFLIGTTPYFLINLLDTKLKFAAAHIWFPFLAWVMYSMTPVIYTVMDVKFQAAYRRLLFCQGPKRSESIRDKSSFHEGHHSTLAVEQQIIIK